MMKKINDFFKKIKKFYKDNFYMCTTLLFGIWVCFFDSNSLLSQQKTKKHINNLEKDKKYYTEQIKTIKEEYNKIKSSEDELQKFAQEKYFMTKKNEEMYLIKED